MPDHSRVFPPVLAALVVAAVSCRRPAELSPQSAPTPLPVELAVDEGIDPDERRPGVVLSARRLELRAPSAAAIVSIRVDHGDLVREGDVLAILESEDARAELSIATAELRALERGRSSARLASKVTRRRHAAVAALRHDGFAAADAVETARLDVDVAAADAERLVAQIEALQTRIARLRGLVDEHQLRSPMTGVVADRMVDPGAFVTTSTTILRLVSEHADIVRFAIEPEDRAAWARGQRVVVRSTASARLTGAIVQSIAPEVDPAANQVFVDARLDDTGTLPVGLAVWIYAEGAPR